MKGLLIKDFKLLKGQKNFFLLIALVVVGMTVFTEDFTFPVGFATFVSALFALSTISYDEFDNGSAFLFSLPISRSLYVEEKYRFGLLTGAAAWLFSFLLVFCAGVYRQTASPQEILLSSLLFLPASLLMQALVLPFYLKFGGERGRLAILGAIGLLFLAGVLAVKIAEAFGIDLGTLLDSLSALRMGTLISAALAAAALLWLLSLRISISIMKHREF